jgi:hypothetical protein
MDGQYERPWEEPGAVRRDCDPHRGLLLQLLGAVSLACGVLALCLWAPGVPGLYLGCLTWQFASKDHAKMQKGLMDPSGEADVERAKCCAACAIMFSLVGFFCIWPLYFLVSASRISIP